MTTAASPSTSPAAAPYTAGKAVIAGIAIGAGAILAVGLVLLALGLNEAFYSDDAVLRAAFKVITFAGDELFFIILVAFLYFGVNKTFARRLVFGFLLNTHVNTFTKVAVQDPRPLTNAGQETGFGFPSGHTQMNVAFWGFSMVYHRHHPAARLPVMIAGALFILLVPVSRMVLGVHDLQDLVGGYVIGAAVLLAYMLVDTRLVVKTAWDWKVRIGVGVAGWMSLWVASILAVPAWASEFGLPCGLLVGIAVGFPLEQEFVRFDLQRLAPAKRWVSGIVGTLLTVATYFALSAAFGSITAVPWIIRLVRYAILGFLVAAIYPWLLKAMLKA